MKNDMIRINDRVSFTCPVSGRELHGKATQDARADGDVIVKLDNNRELWATPVASLRLVP